MPKISALPPGTTPDGTEKIPAIQGGVTVELTVNQVSPVRPNAANTFTAGPQTITPPANSLTQGLVVTQSGPTSGTTAGPFNYNQITVTDSTNIISGSGRDAFDTGAGNSSAFRVNYTASADHVNCRIGGTFAVNFTGTSTVAQPIGLFGSVYTNARVQSMWGIIGYNSLGPTGQSEFMFPIVSELSAQTGSSVNYRSAYVAYTEAPVQGSVLDAVMTVTGFNVGRGAPGGFKNVIALTDFLGGSAPLDTSANFFWSQSAHTVGSFANLPNITVTGNILNFPNMAIGGDGRAIFGGPIAALSAGNTIQAGNAATSIVGLGVTGNTATGSANVTLVSSTTASQMILFANEANRTTVRYGITLGGWNEISAFAGNGLIIGTNNAKPIVFGINNAEVARFSEATPGQLTLGVAGSVVGKIAFGNATSGTQSITPDTGALGSGVAKLIAGTYDLVGTTLTQTLSNKDIVGTTTNNNANAGSVGEYVESNIAAGSAVSLVTATAKDMTTISLTGGDWEVEFIPQFTGGSTTTVSYLTASISLTANTLDQTNGRFTTVPGFSGAIFNIAAPGNAVSGLPFTVRFSVAGATTVHAVGQAGFGVSTCSMYGLLRARRPR